MLVKALVINPFQNFRSMWQFIKKITSTYVTSKHLLEKPKLHSCIKNGLVKYGFFFLSLSPNPTNKSLLPGKLSCTLSFKKLITHQYMHLGLPSWLSWSRICLQCGRPGFDPWVGKISWRREKLPTPVFWPGEFHGLYSPWGRKELDTTE